MNAIKFGRCAAVVLAAALPLTAFATNGYFSNGYSLQQLSMGGAGTAMVEDAGVAALNPAGAVWAGTQFIFNFSLFMPNRYYDASTTNNGSNPSIFQIDPTTNGSQSSNNRHYYIPGMTFNYMLDDKSAVGVTMYGNGGLDTKYNGGSATFGANLPGGLLNLGALSPAVTALLPAVFKAQCQGTFGGGPPVNGTTDALGFCGNSATGPIAGVDLIQLLIAPYYSRKITPWLSLGIEPLIAVQRFKADGLAAFAKFSNHPDEVSDRGYSYSVGGGVRVGFLWDVIHGVGIGGSYQSHVYMTPFRKYAGLFADNGKFDIPSSFNVGLQLHPFAAHRFIFDFQRINYHEISSVGNPLNGNDFVNNCAVPRLLSQLTGGAEGSTAASPSCLGSASGPGFGWHDMVIYKFGYQFQYHNLKLRVGYSFGNNPIHSDQVLFSVLAPGVIERHITGGLSYRFSHAISFDLAGAYAMSHSVYGPNPLSNTPGSVTVGQGGNLVGLKFDAGNDPNDQTIRLNLREIQAAFGVTYRFD